MQVIIYNNDVNSVSIVYPTEQALSDYDINTIAKKSVPLGRKYKIVNIEELPLDGTFNEHGIPNIDQKFRSRWYVEESDLTDGIGEQKL